MDSAHGGELNVLAWPRFRVLVRRVGLPANDFSVSAHIFVNIPCLSAIGYLPLLRGNLIFAVPGGAQQVVVSSVDTLYFAAGDSAKSFLQMRSDCADDSPATVTFEAFQLGTGCVRG